MLSLIDVALAMTSVDVAAAATGGTRPNLEGPYYAVHPLRADGNLIEREPGADVARLSLSGDVTDAVTGCAIPGARLDFWQADDGGLYDRKGSHLRGVVITDAQGHYRITTVLPNDYSEHDQVPDRRIVPCHGRTNTRAAHIHVKVTVDGELLLTTQLFMPTSHFLDRDYVEGAVSDDLIREARARPGGTRGRRDVPGPLRSRRRPARPEHRRLMARSASARLRAMLARGGMVAAPGACDPFTARLIERAGFEAVYLGGNAMGLSLAKGQPLITLTETVDYAARSCGPPICR